MNATTYYALTPAEQLEARRAMGHRAYLAMLRAHRPAPRPITPQTSEGARRTAARMANELLRATR